MPSLPKSPCTAPGCGALTDGGRCDLHRRDHDRKQAQSKPSQQADYRIRGRALQQIRQKHFRREPLCVMCKDKGLVTLATELDHIVALVNGGTDTPDNRQGLCKPCHEIKTLADLRLRPGMTVYGPLWRLPERAAAVRKSQQAFDQVRLPSDVTRSRIPCVMVCGPPNGGKSTYVLAHAGVNDAVIDLDQIIADLSGLPAWESSLWLGRALVERNKQLKALAWDAQHARAWFVISAPDPHERALWATRLGASIVLLAPPLAECIRRIKAKPYHAGYTEQMIEAATDWSRQNDQGVGQNRTAS